MKHIAAALAGVIAVHAAAAACAAQDCPTAQTVARGYIVERGAAVKIEVQHVDDTLVETTWRSGSTVVLQTMAFQGLFELDRLEGGRRTSYRPKTELAKLFPLQPGKELVAEFEIGPGAGQAQTVKIALAVKDAGTIEIGPCKFDIFIIERSSSQSGAAAEVLYTELYAPLLKLTVAKQFKNPDGTTERTQYDRIYSR
jgi:hypothetical protein